MFHRGCSFYYKFKLTLAACCETHTHKIYYLYKQTNYSKRELKMSCLELIVCYYQFITRLEFPYVAFWLMFHPSCSFYCKFKLILAALCETHMQETYYLA